LLGLNCWVWDHGTEWVGLGRYLRAPAPHKTQLNTEERLVLVALFSLFLYRAWTCAAGAVNSDTVLTDKWLLL
jgi:hypothetical protein